MFCPQVHDDGKRMRQRTLNAYLMTVCSSFEFLQAFHSSCAHLAKSTLRAKLKHVLAMLGRKPYFKLFSRSFNPQRRQRATFMKLRRHGSNRDSARFHKLFCPPPTLKLKKDRQWRTKKVLCKHIRGFRGIGPFLAKNFWLNFTLGGVRYPRAEDTFWGEVGPGGRSGINIMMGFPPELLKNCMKESTGAFYSDLATNLRKKLLRHPLLRNLPSDSDAMRAAKDMIRDALSTIEGFQFLACEWSKIVNYTTTGNPIYTRGYWKEWEMFDIVAAAAQDAAAAAQFD